MLGLFNGLTYVCSVELINNKLKQKDMKTNETRKGIITLQKSVVVDLDSYLGRERYYIGTIAGRVIRFSKKVYPNLFQKWNDHYKCEIDMLIARYNDGEEIKGVTIVAKGYKVQ